MQCFVIRLSNAISESGVDRNNNLTLVSIHVRRTDYAHHLQVLFDLKYVEEEYFKNATDYYKNKFNVSDFHFLGIQLVYLFPNST